MNRSTVLRASATVAALVASSVSQAAGIDLTPITAAVDVGTISVAIIALAAIMMGPNVAKWAGKKLAGFFGN